MTRTMGAITSELVEVHQQLEELKEQSEEVVKALDLEVQFTELLEELEDMARDHNRKAPAPAPDPASAPDPAPAFPVLPSIPYNPIPYQPLPLWPTTIPTWQYWPNWTVTCGPSTTSVTLKVNADGTTSGEILTPGYDPHPPHTQDNDGDGEKEGGDETRENDQA